MDQYTELYCWMWSAFGKEQFSLDQFRSVFPTSQAAKVIHDLAKKGYVQRVKRGTYRVTEPGEFIKRVSEQKEPDDRILEKSGKKYAFCESTAVAVWTDGYYWTGFTRGFRPVHIAVTKRDLDSWRDFFRKRRVKHALEKESKTLYGKVYILHPRKSVKVTIKDGMRVVPLEEVVDFCLEREIGYEPALEYLDEKYRIGYSRRESLET